MSALSVVEKALADESTGGVQEGQHRSGVSIEAHRELTARLNVPTFSRSTRSGAIITSRRFARMSCSSLRLERQISLIEFDTPSHRASIVSARSR